ncbi:MAG: DUF1501 domain-containing protein [Planctomycetes bacterium]|nr:DUF1501 domain-containing protein [Planctomycetota bacterium]
MSRRHFMSHLSTATMLTAPVAHWFIDALRAGAADMRRHHKAAILLFMEGGPATIDIWDLKPGQPTGGQFKPISTSGGGQISEHLPLLAKQMHHLSIVRSMSTREADHQRGRYYMHTGYVPNPNIEHPSYGAVIAHELAGHAGSLDVPPFISIGGASIGPGFLGMSFAPLVVDSNGDVRNLKTSLDTGRLTQRMQALGTLERSFAGQDRGEAAVEHGKVLQSTVNLMTSQQLSAFKVNSEPAAVLERYGAGGSGGGGGGGGNRRNAAFGKGCLMARRLVEAGVPFVEVDFGGWDDHQDVFSKLKDRLPVMDQAMSALVEDLNQRGMWKDTVVIWMGDFGRTPRINGRGGRDHWARSWSVVVGGGGFRSGEVVGKTNVDGTAVEGDPYTSQDLMASVLKSLGISLETTFTSKNNRPMKIANSGRVIRELFA